MTAAATIAAAAGGAGPAPDKVRITATRKTADQKAGGVRRTADAQGRSTEEQVFYRFELTRIVPSAPAELVADWLIVIEGPAGGLHPGIAGRDEVVLDLGKPVVLETQPVAVKGLQWNVGGFGHTGGIRESVYGYAIRLLDQKGNLVAEKYQPRNLEQRTEALGEEWNKKRQLQEFLEQLGKKKQPPAEETGRPAAPRAPSVP